MTADSLPYIGPHRRYPRHWFALGYGGNGMTFGSWRLACCWSDGREWSLAITRCSSSLVCAIGDERRFRPLYRREHRASDLAVPLVLILSSVRAQGLPPVVFRGFDEGTTYAKSQLESGFFEREKHAEHEYADARFAH